MSITLKASVSFGLTIIVEEETMEYVRKARAAIKELSAEQMTERMKEADGEERFKCELFRSSKTDEEVTEIIYRTSLRTFLRSELHRELCNDESRARIGNIKVDFNAGAPCGCNACHSGPSKFCEASFK